MRLRAGAALAVLTLPCCLCIATAGAQANASSPEGAPAGTALGRDVAPEDSDEDYLVDEQRAYRHNITTSERQTGLKDRRFTVYRSEDLERSRRQFVNLRDIWFAPDTRDYYVVHNSILGTEPYNFRDYEGSDSATNVYVGPVTKTFATPSTGDFNSSRAIDAAARGIQPTQSTNAGQRWLNILAEFLKTSSEGRELLRGRPAQLLEGASAATAGRPRPLLLLPVPHQHQPDVQRPVDENEEFHRTLLELFRLARPRAPLLPPLLLPTSPRPAPAASLSPILPMPPLARLHFDRSLLIRAELTVFYSDYTEPYTVWYDAESGSSRVDLHGGSTVLFRDVQSAGDVQRVQFVIERHGEDEIRRCTLLTSSVVAADRSSPGLPDPEPFSFDGYQDTADGRLERWSYRLAGQAGELGAARGEALVFRHELLVARVGPDFAIPYRYRVTVDSSVLGPEVDRYEHRYLEVREQRPDPGHLSIDVKRQCDALQRAHRVDQVDPLRQFVMTHRDSRKPDTDFEKFKETNEVSYEDMVEEAVRKTMLIRSTRFVESANRQGASALMGVNAFGVMLPAERHLLLGLVNEDEEFVSRSRRQTPEDEERASPSSERGDLKPDPFPYSLQETARIATQLPAAFSWKRRGAVTHVRNQGYCRTCWAFAVVAAVEGALFRRTGRLVALSEQQLADCSRGPHSCRRGNTVRNPYQRIRDAGVVALGDYSRYKYLKPKVAQCRKEDSPVTYINGFVRVTNSSDALKVSIVRHGPNVVEVDSECGGFVYFNKGVLRDMRCNPNARNHAVTAIGFGRHKNHGDYFIVKNSWGLAGNNGYVHLHAATNTAGVHTAPSYPLLAADDVPDTRRLESLATQYPDERSLFDTGDSEEYREFLKQQKEYLEKVNDKTQNQRPQN